MEQNQVELPEKFLKRWLVASNKGDLSEAAIEQEFPAFAENLRWTIVRDKIKEQFDLEVTEEEVKGAFLDKIRNYFGAQVPDELLETSALRLMQNEKDVEETRRDLEIDKVFRAIRDQVSIKDKAIPSEEFHKIVDSFSAKAKAEQDEADVTIL